LIQRWLDHGHSVDDARDRALSNDIPNAKLVCEHIRLPSSVMLFF
jgi:pantothenate kinase